MLTRGFVAVAAIVAVVPQVAAAEPTKLAATARFDIRADAAAWALEDGRAVEGGATVERMNWVPEAERSVGYTVNIPVTFLGWRTAAIRFTPARAGRVSITLSGPWEEASKGVLYKQEVLWDDVRVEGGRLEDGGFESTRGGRSGSWVGEGQVLARSADVPAVEGTHYARTRHNRTLSGSIAVAAGRPVTIRLSARAVRPEGFVEMKRIAGKDTPAHRAARRFRRGANLGNGFEVPPGQDWAVAYTPEDIRHIRAEGFDHVRIPVGWHHYTGPGPAYRIRPEFLARVDRMVDAGLEAGLGVMINIHHFDDFTSDPKGQTPRFLAIWGQLAAHYAGRPEGLVYELLNEPKDAATTEVMIPIYAEAIRRIRKLDPARTIFVGPGRWNGVDELARFRLPEDDHNLIVTVHNYDPFLFSHQGATWSGPDTKVTGIVFPGPPPTPLEPDPNVEVGRWVCDWIARYNTQPTATNPCSPAVIQGVIAKAREWSEYYGRPIHFGEFGCLATIDARSRANYYRTFRRAAEEAGAGWAIWDWRAGFHYWDETADRPAPGMHEALFGRGSARAGR